MQGSERPYMPAPWLGGLIALRFAGVMRKVGPSSAPTWRHPFFLKAPGAAPFPDSRPRESRPRSTPSHSDACKPRRTSLLDDGLGPILAVCDFVVPPSPLVLIIDRRRFSRDLLFLGG